MADVGQLPREDLVGKTAFDNSGQKIGEIEHCYLDVETDTPWWVAVKTGLLGSKSRLAPLTGAAMTAEGVGLAYTKDHIKAAPDRRSIDLYRGFLLGLWEQVPCRASGRRPFDDIPIREEGR